MVAIEKGAFWSPSTTVAIFTYLYWIYFPTKLSRIVRMIPEQVLNHSGIYSFFCAEFRLSQLITVKRQFHNTYPLVIVMRQVVGTIASPPGPNDRLACAIIFRRRGANRSRRFWQAVYEDEQEARTLRPEESDQANRTLKYLQVDGFPPSICT